jgi:protocatechuate 3,4-dioxygenase beta subunit
LLELLVATAFFAQTAAPQSPRPQDKPPARCTVAGRVVAAADGAPLKSARVALVPERKDRHPHIYATSSDSDGRFLLKNVEPGRYNFFANRVGFVDQHYQSQGTESGGAILTLREGQKITDALFRLTVAAVITGRILDEEDQPIPGVRVNALRRATDDDAEDDDPFFSGKKDLLSAGGAETDDRGQYRIFGLRPGEYYVKANDSLGGAIDEEYDLKVRESLGTGYAAVYYPGVLQLDQAQSISVRPGEESQADFSVRHIKVVEVAGRVITPDGPARNAEVVLIPFGEDESSSSRYDQPDEKGAFALKGVTPGTYTLRAFGRGDGDKVYVTNQKIEVGNDSLNSLIITLGIGVTLKGRVKAEGGTPAFLDQLGVVLGGDEAQWAGIGRVKKDGSFEIASVNEGTYSVVVWELQHDWYVKSAQMGTQNVLEEGLQVSKDSPGGAMEIVLSKDSAQLEGSVIQHDRPLIGARVRLTPDPETRYNRTRSRSAKTDQSGRFSLTGLAPGKYKIVAKPPSATATPDLKSEPQTFTLAEHDHKSIQLTISDPQEH